MTVIHLDLFKLGFSPPQSLPLHERRYEPVEVRTRVEAILSMNGFVGATDEARPQEGDVGVVLQRTPFYAEQGGQVADHGTIASASGSFTVHDTRVSAPQPSTLYKQDDAD